MDRVRVGVIGCGGIAGWHVENLLRLPGAEIVGLVDPVADQLDAMRVRHPSVTGVPGFATTEELYAAVELDAVEIITPHTMHYDQVIEAIDHGLHVLCEKPLACEPAHVREIAAAADSKDLTVTVSYQRRLDPAYQYMHQVIASGGIGEIRAIAITCGQSWATGTRGSWRQDPALSGGGMLMDSGSHMIDMLLWLVTDPVIAVAANVDNRGTPVDIDTTAIVRFANGIQGQLTVIGDLPTTWIEQVLVTGSSGLLRYEIEPQHPWRTGRVVHYRDEAIVQPLQLPPAITTDAAWLAAIRGDAPNFAAPASVLGVIELTSAIYAAADQQRRHDAE